MANIAGWKAHYSRRGYSVFFKYFIPVHVPRGDHNHFLWIAFFFDHTAKIPWILCQNDEQMLTSNKERNKSYCPSF